MSIGCIEVFHSCAAHQGHGPRWVLGSGGWERMPAFAKSVLLPLTGSRKMEIKPITNQSINQSINHSRRGFWGFRFTVMDQAWGTGRVIQVTLICARRGALREDVSMDLMLDLQSWKVMPWNLPGNSRGSSTPPAACRGIHGSSCKDQVGQHSR